MATPALCPLSLFPVRLKFLCSRLCDLLGGAVSAARGDVVLYARLRSWLSLRVVFFGMMNDDATTGCPPVASARCTGMELRESCCHYWRGMHDCGALRHPSTGSTHGRRAVTMTPPSRPPANSDATDT